MKNTIKVIRQHDERDCGVACLATVACYHGLDLPLAKVRELTKSDRMGTNIYGLVDGARQLGMEAEALEGSPDDLYEALRDMSVTLPFIALLCKDGARMHFVTVFAVEGTRVLVGDPGVGKQYLSLEQFFAEWTGCVVNMRPTALLKESHHGLPVMQLLGLLSGQLNRIGLILLLSVFVSGISIGGAFVFQVVIDSLTTGQSSAMPLGTVFAVLVGLYILQAAIQFARGKLLIALSGIIDTRLSLEYYNHIVDLPMSSISTRQTGEYLSRFSDTATIRNAVSEATVTLVMDTLMAIACGAILCYINVRLFAVALVMVALYVAVILAFRKTLERSNRTVMEESGKLQSFFKESIDGLETVKAANANAQVKDKTNGRFSVFIGAALRNAQMEMTQGTIAMTVEAIGTVGILWSGFILVETGAITLGSLMTFYALLAYFAEPIKHLIDLQPTLQTAFVALDRLNDVLFLEKEETFEGSLSAEGVSDVELRDVSFRYGNRELVLDGVNLTLRRGQKVALVGESGSGKTTLAKLLLRFYQPESGEMLLDGHPIEDYDVASLRDSIAYVDQNTFLFSDTVRNNVRLARPDATDDEVEEACRIACADGFIQRLPFGYDTILDENGANISGGQRQRLAIARALLRHPRLLIMDEATSNLDTVTERAIGKTIFEDNKGLTCLIIAHRLSTIRQCDKIVVMDARRVAESGTHEELMRLRGRYYDLVSAQSVDGDCEVPDCPALVA